MFARTLRKRAGSGISLRHRDAVFRDAELQACEAVWLAYESAGFGPNFGGIRNVAKPSPMSVAPWMPWKSLSRQKN